MDKPVMSEGRRRQLLERAGVKGEMPPADPELAVDQATQNETEIRRQGTHAEDTFRKNVNEVRDEQKARDRARALQQNPSETS